MADAKTILCAGISVQDIVMQVERFPDPGMKIAASNFVMIPGGETANASVAISRLGGRARYAGPLGDDDTSNWIVAALKDEGIGTGGVVQVAGKSASVSLILIDRDGEKMIATRRGANLIDVAPNDPRGQVADIDALLVDNRLPEFVMPLCEAAKSRGVPVVVDGDKESTIDHPLWGLATHVVFSAQGLRGTTGIKDLGQALLRVAETQRCFLAVTDGPNGVIWIEDGRLREMPGHTVAAIDSLGAGDTFHGAFTLALAEGKALVPAMLFASAAAALKCTRFGGVTVAPSRAEVEDFIKAQPLDVPAKGP